MKSGGEYRGPSILDHALAGWDMVRQLFSGSGSVESIAIIREPRLTWPVKLEIFPRGGERISLQLPNGLQNTVRSRDIIHWVGADHSLLGRFRASKPMPGFSIVR